MGGSGRTEEVLEEKEDQEDDIWVADLLGEVAILMTDRGVVLWVRIRREEYLLKGTLVDQDLMKGEDSQNIPVIKQVFPINMRGKFWMNMAKEE